MPQVMDSDCTEPDVSAQAFVGRFPLSQRLPHRDGRNRRLAQVCPDGRHWRLPGRLVALAGLDKVGGKTYKSFTRQTNRSDREIRCLQGGWRATSGQIRPGKSWRDGIRRSEEAEG